MKTSVTFSAELMSALLDKIVGFMLRSGVSGVDVRRMLADAAAVTCAMRKTQVALPTGFDFSTAAAIKLWHSDPRYLTAEAKPRSLALRGKAPSVESLIRKACAGDHQQVLSALLSSRMLRRTRGGKYLPAEECAIVQGLHPIAIEHVTKTVIRLVETAMRNTAAQPRDVALIERFALVPDLDVREARAFAEFTQRQGVAYLQAVDDWLEGRRKARRPDNPRLHRSTTGAGVHLFAYIGDDMSDRLIPAAAALDAESFRHLSWEAVPGNKRVAAPYMLSGAVA
ncbi:MAG: hypothetical protein LBE59_04145 [Nevskiaceae bacterium]|nr:hypothetical protein [Nevskiaceae bacterium]